jgi:hypothetical protein
MDQVQKKKKKKDDYVSTFSGSYSEGMYSTMDYIGHATTTNKLYSLKNIGLG